MAITQAMCASFKREILLGVHDLSSDNLKIALYTSSANLDASTTAYSALNEISGSGYTAGGASLSGITVTLDGFTAVVDFADITWLAATLTARGALIYNATKGDKAIAVLNFGVDKSSSAGDFTIGFPAAAAGSAILQVG